MAAYVVMTRTKMKDQAAFDVYSEMAGAAGAGHPLTPHAIYGDFEVLEGPQHEGMVIISFPTREEALNWYHSPAYKAAKAQRDKGAEYSATLIEGI